MPTQAEAAVQRALRAKQQAAAEEVERILEAAVRLMQEHAPQMPRVSDVVAEARTSNKAFYRYFGGKEDLLCAVMERGVLRVAAHVRHQQAKEATPTGRLAQAIRILLAQAADPVTARDSHAVSTQFRALTMHQTSEASLLAPLREVFADPIEELGSVDVTRDAEATLGVTMHILRGHLERGTTPTARDADHLVSFCHHGVSSRPAGTR